MRVSPNQVAAVYQRPVTTESAVVARRESPVAPLSGEAASSVALSPAASAFTEHLAEAGESHKADGCDTCISARELSAEDKEKVAELKQRDAEVRRHEQAHVAAAGSHANGGPHYEFERGPDGKQYAVSGHVNIDTAAVSGDPAATLQKAETIRRAALAPSEPSGQDQRVAAKADAMAATARRELAQEKASDEPIVSGRAAVAAYQKA